MTSGVIVLGWPLWIAGILGVVGCIGRRSERHNPLVRNGILWSFLDSQLLVISGLAIAAGGTLLLLS
jgi:hypothetical protein